MRKTHHIHTIISTLFVTLMIFSYFLWKDYTEFISDPMAIPDLPYKLVVRKGDAFYSIVDKLHNDGVIEKPYYLLWYVKQKGLAGKVHAGEYTFQEITSPAGFVGRLTSGKVDQHSITLVEGWSFKQIMQVLAAHPQLEKQVGTESPGEIARLLGMKATHPEGWFYPDTYLFPSGTSDIDVLRRAYRTMQTHLEKVWAKRHKNIPLKSPYEALILASIVEKETGIARERAEIAGVFTRRLLKGMRLQTDPTVIYGMGDHYKGNIRRKDLRTDTPYNTYTRQGLPPTPIAIPGFAALHAAVQPAQGDTLYFVAKGDGSHYFSSTLGEHNRAVAKYQLKKK